MQNRHGSNGFNPNTNIRQNNVANNNPQFGHFSGNISNIPQPSGRFNRPHLTPPTRFTNTVDGTRFLLPYEAETRVQSVMPQFSPRGPHPSEVANTGSLPNTNQMPPPYFQEQRFPTPSNQGTPNMPLMIHNQPFNPNVPPPSMPPPQASFRAPPPGHVVLPRQPVASFNQQPLPFQPPNIHQTNTHSRYPPPLNNNKHMQEQERVVKSQLEKMRDSSQKSEDEKWVMDWTQKKQKMSDMQKMQKMQTCTVSEVQEKTRYMMILLARLQKGKQNLESMKNEDRTVWEQKLKEVMLLKKELETLQSDLTNEEIVTALKRKVERTRKKRERIKRQKMAHYERRKEELAHREQVNAQIDKKMQQVIEKQRLKKQEEDMKREADQILGQVRKKISDANKTIHLLNSVQKLRSLRKERLARQGVLSMYERHGDSSTKSVMFETKCTDMITLLNKQLDTYKSEEEALKVILETEQEETREKEREKAKQKHRERLKQEKMNEQKMLFGDQKDPRSGDPLYPFWQYYTAAENSLEALVSIRQGWDMYLVLPHTPGASCLPDDWVIPPEPSSDIWNTAIQDSIL